MYVDQGDKELNATQPTPFEKKDEGIALGVGRIVVVSWLHHEDAIPTSPTSTEVVNKGNNIGAELVVRQEKVSKSENSCVPMMIPCSKLNLHNVDLIIHKEVLTRIFPNNSLYYIMFDKPIELSSMIDRVSEIACLKLLVSTNSCTYLFNLIGDYSVEDKIYVYRICITCDKLGELRLYVMGVQSIIKYFDCLELSVNDSTCCLEIDIRVFGLYDTFVGVMYKLAPSRP